MRACVISLYKDLYICDFAQTAPCWRISVADGFLYTPPPTYLFIYSLMYVYVENCLPSRTEKRKTDISLWIESRRCLWIFPAFQWRSRHLAMNFFFSWRTPASICILNRRCWLWLVTAAAAHHWEIWMHSILSSFRNNFAHAKDIGAYYYTCIILWKHKGYVYVCKEGRVRPRNSRPDLISLVYACNRANDSFP